MHISQCAFNEMDGHKAGCNKRFKKYTAADDADMFIVSQRVCFATSASGLANLLLMWSSTDELPAQPVAAAHEGGKTSSKRNYWQFS